MCDFDETFARLAPNSLSRRIRHDQFGLLGLEPLELVHQAVEAGLRLGGVIAVVVRDEFEFAAVDAASVVDQIEIGGGAVDR